MVTHNTLYSVAMSVAFHIERIKQDWMECPTHVLHSQNTFTMTLSIIMVLYVSLAHWLEDNGPGQCNMASIPYLHSKLCIKRDFCIHRGEMAKDDWLCRCLNLCAALVYFRKNSRSAMRFRMAGWACCSHNTEPVAFICRRKRWIVVQSDSPPVSMPYTSHSSPLLLLFTVVKQFIEPVIEIRTWK